MKKKSGAVELVFFLGTSVVVTAAGSPQQLIRRHTIRSVPNPTLDAVACGATEAATRTHLCDPDGILNPNDRIAIDAAIARLEGADELRTTRTGTPCDVVVPAPTEAAVVIIKHVDVDALLSEKSSRNIRVDDDDDDDSGRLGEATERLARGLHDAWGVGDAACATGVLVLLATEDRQTYVSTGDAPRRTYLTDARAGRVQDALRPELRAGRFADALVKALDEIATLKTRGPPNFAERLADAVPSMLFFGCFAGVLGLAVSGALAERRAHRRDTRTLGDAKTHLRALEALRDAGKAPDTCPVCLDKLVSTETSPAAGSSSASSSDEVCVLRCDHVFHRRCLDAWLDGSSGGSQRKTCPICRRDVHYVDAPRGTTPTAHDHRAVFARHAVPGSLAGAAEPELRFRLDRIRARYPRYVTTRHVDAWTRRRFSGPLANDPDCPLVVPPSTAASSGSHRHRSSSSSGGGRGGGSFSGGSSAGGAGRGF